MAQRAARWHSRLMEILSWIHSSCPFPFSPAVCSPYRREPTHSSQGNRQPVRRHHHPDHHCRHIAVDRRHGIGNAVRFPQSGSCALVACKRRYRDSGLRRFNHFAFPAPRRGGHGRAVHRRPDALLACPRYASASLAFRSSRWTPAPSSARSPYSPALPRLCSARRARRRSCPRSALGVDLLALVAGAALPVQGAVNGLLRSDIGAPVRCRHGQLRGRNSGDDRGAAGHARLAGCAKAAASGLSRMPWWGWLGAFCGATYVTTVFTAIPVIGTAAAVGLTVAGQQIASLFVDRYGWFRLPKREISEPAPHRRPNPADRRWLNSALLNWAQGRVGNDGSASHPTLACGHAANCLVHRSKRRLQPEFGKIDAQQKDRALARERSECVSARCPIRR